jgi:hypothetical protein
MRPRSIRLPRRKALDWAAAALVAVAVFVVPGVAIGLSNGGLTGLDAFYGIAGLCVGLAALWLQAHRRRETAAPAETIWVIAAGSFLAWITGVGAFIVFYGAAFCGNGRLADTVSWVAFFLVYFVVAVWALLGRYRPLLGLPLAVALAALVHYGALAVIPGGRGYCET